MLRKAFLIMLIISLSIAICLTVAFGGAGGLVCGDAEITDEVFGDVALNQPRTSPIIYMGDADTAVSYLSLSAGTAAVIEPTLSENDSETNLEWTSSDSAVVRVDSGGKVNAESEGAAIVRAESKLSSFEYNITVTEAEKSEYDGYSTCITANADVLERNIESSFYTGMSLYYIKVNRRENCVTVYTYDSNGEYTVPVRAMVCSCGADDGTITGDYSIYLKNEWNGLYGDVYGHYVSGIYGDFLFHSVPYYYASSDTLETEEFNKLGTSASMGCVRMAAADVKWIFENCDYYTGVTIYDDDTAGPLGKPDTIKITDLSCGWDPTDDSSENPYNDKRPEIIGASDAAVELGGEFNAAEGVTAVDTCGNDITEDMVVTSHIITDKAGVYSVTYEVEDAMHRTASAEITVTVG